MPEKSGIVASVERLKRILHASNFAGHTIFLRSEHNERYRIFEHVEALALKQKAFRDAFLMTSLEARRALDIGRFDFSFKALQASLRHTPFSKRIRTPLGNLQRSCGVSTSPGQTHTSTEQRAMILMVSRENIPGMEGEGCILTARRCANVRAGSKSGVIVAKTRSGAKRLKIVFQKTPA